MRALSFYHPVGFLWGELVIINTKLICEYT